MSHNQDQISDEILDQRAEMYAHALAKKQIKGEIREYLACRLGPQWYMVDVRHLHEILSLQRMFVLPRNKKYLSGFINVRGNVVLVANIKALLDIPQDSDSFQARIILTRLGEDVTGFIADEVLKVDPIDTHDIKPVISTIQGLRAEFINGLYQKDDKHFVVLNLERLWVDMVNKLGS